MFDPTEYSLPKKSKAFLVSLVTLSLEGHKTEEQTLHSLTELKELLRTLEIQSVDQMIQKRDKMESGTTLGKGKLEEIAELAKKQEVDFLVFDYELSASQARNIKKITGLEVVDRCSVILEIFAQHARTNEAKIQIEISRLKYLLPRLTNFWTHFGRQKGGVGVMGGEGEQQLELDRRIVREKIEKLKKQLVAVEKSRREQRKNRANKSVKAALVGYTNAGKSSLMNRLCQVKVLEEDKLFATLDSTFRMLTPDTKPPMLLIDTVGFISNLPSTLIEGFKTTLESALEADLLLIVVDVSDPNFEKHIQVTIDVLKEIGVDEKDRFFIFNKKDLAENLLKQKIATAKYHNSFIISALDKEDVDSLREKIIAYFLSQQEELDLFVPYEDGESHAKVEGKANILKRKNHETGIYYKIKVPKEIFHSLSLNNYLLDPDSPYLS